MGDAVMAFIGLLATLVAIEPWLLRSLSHPAWVDWSIQHVMLPLARSSCVLVFIVLGYPDLFGLSQAPALGPLLSQENRWSHLLNLSFALSMALPLLPTLERFPGAVLPLQGFLLLALLFQWATPDAVNTSLWPSLQAWAALALAALAPVLARW